MVDFYPNFSPIVKTLPLLCAGSLALIYCSAMFFPHSLAGLQGLLSGGFLAGYAVRKLEPYEKEIDDFVKNICLNYYPELINKTA